METDNSTGDDREYSETEIAVHRREEECVAPPHGLASQANSGDRAVLERFTEDHFPACFEEYAELLSWDRRWDTVLDHGNPPFFKWWVGGHLNACLNCVYRHLADRADRDALI